jgi:membrane-associated phospholipid phosphatase
MRSCKQSLIGMGVVFFCFGSLTGFAQSAELGFLKDINPRYPVNAYYKALSSTAKPLSIAVPFGLLAVSLIKDDKKLETDAYEMAAGLAFTAVATEALKVLVKRDRPYVKYNDIYPDFIDDGNSFPSGHTSLAFSTATSVFLLYKKWYYTVPVFVWASGVAYSRIYLGQHYPSDVLAGAIVGAGGAYASHWLNKKFFSGKKKKQSLPSLK